MKSQGTPLNNAAMQSYKPKYIEMSLMATKTIPLIYKQVSSYIVDLAATLTCTQSTGGHGQ